MPTSEFGIVLAESFNVAGQRVILLGDNMQIYSSAFAGDADIRKESGGISFKANVFLRCVKISMPTWSDYVKRNMDARISTLQLLQMRRDCQCRAVWKLWIWETCEIEFRPKIYSKSPALDQDRSAPIQTQSSCQSADPITQRKLYTAENSKDSSL